MEPLLDPTRLRLVMLPVEYPDIYEFYQKALASFWTVQEVDLSQDKYEDLSEGEKHFLKHVLAFFAASDSIVNMNLEQNFSKEIMVPEAKAFFHFQETMEDIHSTMYATLLLEYIKDSEDRETLINAVTTIPSIQQKAEWTMKWIHHTGQPFAQRLVAFAIVEGIYFSGAFCAIYWFSEQNKMPGLCKSNHFIARDEGMHTDFACLLYSKIVNRLREETVHEMVKEAVSIEEYFVREALPCSLLGMNAAMMSAYVRFVADRLVVDLGYSPIYKVKNPFQFMNHISLEAKTNFFEQRPAEYQKAATLNKTTNATTIFSVSQETF